MAHRYDAFKWSHASPASGGPARVANKAEAPGGYVAARTMGASPNSAAKRVWKQAMSIARPLTMAVLLLVVFAPHRASAQKDEYGYDIKKRYRAALRSWQKVVPSKYRKVPWIYKLDGTSVPIKRVTIAGRVFLTGTVCEPHDCGDNTIAFVVADRGGAAYGLLRSTNQAPDGDEAFGKPDPEKRQLLLRVLEGDVLP